MLDATIPKDTDPVSSFPKVLRETRTAIIKDGISGVVFEPGVEQGDAVFLDKDYNIWRRARAGHATRSIFHGIANLEQSAVIIFGFFRDDRWAFTPGETVFVSNTNNGELTTETDTGLIAGVAAQLDYLLLDSQISAAFGRLKDEVINGRGGLGSLNARFLDDEEAITALETEVHAARGTSPSVTERMAASEAEISTARASFSNLDARLDTFTDTQAEVVAGRKGQASLVAKMNSVDLNISNLQAEVIAGRGSTVSLYSFLSAAHNADGTLKSTITVSTWVQLTGTFSRLNDTTMTFLGDASFLAAGGAGRGLQIDGVTGIYVESATYNSGTGYTTIITTRTAIPATITGVYYGFSKSELPLYEHSDLHGIETGDPTSTDTTRNKHVSNADMKGWKGLLDDVSTVAGNGLVPRADSLGKLDNDYLPDATSTETGALRRGTLFEAFSGEAYGLAMSPRMAGILQAVATMGGGTTISTTDPCVDAQIWN